MHQWITYLTKAKKPYFVGIFWTSSPKWKFFWNIWLSCKISEKLWEPFLRKTVNWATDIVWQADTLTYCQRKFHRTLYVWRREYKKKYKETTWYQTHSNLFSINYFESFYLVVQVSLKTYLKYQKIMLATTATIITFMSYNKSFVANFSRILQKRIWPNFFFSLFLFCFSYLNFANMYVH